MATSLVTYAALLKTLYPKKKIFSMAYKDYPFFGMVPKNTGFVGDGMKVPVHYGLTNVRSHTAATALGGSVLTGTSKEIAFTVTRTQNFSAARMDRETIKASQNDAGAFKRHFEHAVDDAMLAHNKSVAIGLYRSSSGSVGRIKAGSTVSTTVTLSAPEDAFNFEVGELITVSSADGSGSLRASGTTAAITGVDEENGTLTFGSSLASTISGTVAGDYIFKAGDHAAGMSGLASWIPSSNPAATSFFGVNRSVSPVRLGGLRVDASNSSASIEDVLIKAATKLGKLESAPNICLVPFNKWEELAKSLQGQRRFGEVKSSDGVVGFESLVVSGPRGKIDVVADVNCPSDRSYLLQLDTWELASLGEVPHIVDDAGAMQRVVGVDQFQVDIASYSQLVCRAPGKNAVILW